MILRIRDIHVLAREVVIDNLDLLRALTEWITLSENSASQFMIEWPDFQDGLSRIIPAYADCLWMIQWPGASIGHKEK